MKHRKGLNVQALADQLAAAVDELVEPQTQKIQNQWRHCPSLYQQLIESVGSAVSEGKGSGGAAWGFRSLPTIWVDATDLITDIDTKTVTWVRTYLRQPAGKDPAARLRMLTQVKWTPDQTNTVKNLTAAVCSWAHSISSLLDPVHTKTISAPCPNCGSTHIYRDDSGGDNVRMPALVITTDGCECRKCGTWWPPERFALLASVLSQKQVVVLEFACAGEGKLTAKTVAKCVFRPAA